MAQASKSLDLQASALLTLSLVGYPAVAPISILVGIPSYVVSVPFRAVVLGLAISILARTLVTSNRLKMTPFWIAWSVFWTLYIVRIVVDSMLAPEALRLPLSEYLLYAVGTCLLPALGVSTRVSPNVMRRAFLATLAIGAVAIVANIVVIATKLSVQSLAAFFTGRLASKTLDPISLAHLGITVFILSAWGLIRRDIRGGIPVYILLATSLAGIGAAVMAASRGPLLTLVVVAPLLLLEGFRTDRRSTSLLLAALALPIVVLLWVMRNVESIFIFTRLQGFASDEIRRGLWRSGWDVFLARPILGGGTEPLGFYPHNTILESLILYGLFSGLLYCAMLVISVRAAMKIISSRSEHGWAALVFMQVSIGMMVSGALYGPPSQWVLMVAVIGSWHALSRQAIVTRRADIRRWPPQYSAT